MAENNDLKLEDPPPDGFGRFLFRLDRLLRWPENAMNFVAALATLTLVFAGVWQIVVGMRDLCTFGEDPVCIGLINKPLFGYIDLIELCMPILAVIGIAYCQRLGTHIRMDLLMSRLTGRVLWSVESFAAFMTLLLAILLALFSYDFFYDAYNLGDSTTDANLNTWPSKLLVPIAFWMLAARVLVQFLGAVRLAMDPDKIPVGVVVQKDIAEQAQEEIREAMVGAERS